MRGLIVCFAIACLALANGASTNETTSVAYTKNFDYGEKEVIYGYQPLHNDELVYAVCEGSSDEKKCKVYIESVNQDETTVHSCDLNLKYSGRFDYNVEIFNVGNTRALIAVREDFDKSSSKIRLITVNLKGCHVKDTSSVGVRKQLIKKYEPLQVYVVPHKDNYDIVYKNEDLCHRFCKATFDYEGKIVKTPAEFMVKPFDDGFLQIEKANKGYFIGQITADAGIVYVLEDEHKAPILLYDGEEAVIGLSNAENKLGFCVHRNRKLLCKQYDAEGKTKKIEVEIETGEGEIQYIDVLNLEKGILTLSVNRSAGSTYRTLFVVHFDEQGQQRKSARVDPKCNRQQRIIPELYKNASGQYCASIVCVPFFDSSKDKNKFSRSTRWFNHNELF